MDDTTNPTVCRHYAQVRPFSMSLQQRGTFYPTNLRSAYNFPSAYTGVGQKIGFIELGGGFVQNDLNNFFHANGLARVPTVQFVSILGATNHPTNANSADAEVMLDLTVAIGVAPGITPVVYMAPNTTAGFVAAINRAVSDGCNAISISWGAPENQWTTNDINSMNTAFGVAMSRNVSVFAASGDSGSSDGESGKHVDFPGSSPYVTSCGGTRLVTNNSFQWVSESVWNDGSGASGGGVSALFATPTWQNGLGLAKRGVPDVASVADPATGIIVPIDGASYVIGGTSAAAPFWAGLVAVLNQAAGRNAGFINPLIYPLFLNYTGAFANAPMHDVTVGSNGAFSAKRGWDSCTGCGTPNAQLLLNAALAAFHR